MSSSPLHPRLHAIGSPRVAIVGAFDRFNYGDVLFPVIVDEALQRYQCPWPRAYYATRRSDLSGQGGKRTQPLRDLFHAGALPPGSVVLVAGGEVLDADWTGTLENVLTRPWAYLLDKIRDRCGRNFANSVTRLLSGTRLEFPWIFSPADFMTPVRVAYNAVGGSSVEGLPMTTQMRLQDKLAQAAYLSVRDRPTLHHLESSKQAANVHLAPDSAVLMPLFYPRTRLAKLVSPVVARLLEPLRNGYLCFQINRALGSGQARPIAQELAEVARRHHLGILLLPNGRARNHEDQVALGEIHSLLPAPAVFAGGDLSIFDIMFLVARAAVYAGTSLHGNLTALAFGVPHVGLTQRVPKLEAFLNTWDLPEQRGCVPLEGLSRRVAEVLQIPPADRERKSVELVEASLRNFEALFEATGIPGSFGREAGSLPVGLGVSQLAGQR